VVRPAASASPTSGQVISSSSLFGSSVLTVRAP
jgi:hypothetical protein